MSSSPSSVIGDQLFSNLAVQRSIVSNTLNSNVANVNTLNAPLINSGAIDTLGIMAGLAVLDNVQSLTGAFVDLEFGNGTGDYLDIVNKVQGPLGKFNVLSDLNGTGLNILSHGLRVTSATGATGIHLTSNGAADGISMTTVGGGNITATSSGNLTLNVTDDPSGILNCVAPTILLNAGTGGLRVPSNRVTQITSASTPVVCHGVSGNITTVSQMLTTGNSATFTVDNHWVHYVSGSQHSIILLTLDYSGAGIPVARVQHLVSETSFDITISNVGSATMDAAVIVSFLVLNHIA